VVATEDETIITINPTVPFVGIGTGSFSITLNRGETYVFSASSSTANGKPMGTTITSNKPIAITTKDMNRGSINNIAAILVHESYHLKLWNEGIKIDPNKEEREAYIWEYEFLCKLPNVEDWLFLHTVNQIIRYSH
jgi:hypothetical protein